MYEVRDIPTPARTPLPGVSQVCPADGSSLSLVSTHVLITFVVQQFSVVCQNLIIMF